MRRPRLTRSARSFIDAYRPERFYVVNSARDARDAIGRTEVHWVRPSRLVRFDL